MAAIKRRSPTDLMAAVGAVIDLEVTTNSTPDRTQVKIWLTDGAVAAFGILPFEALTDCIVIDTGTGYSMVDTDFTTGVLRVASVTSDGIGCIKLTEDQFKTLSLTPYKYTAGNPAYSVIQTAAGASVQVYPQDATAALSVSYVPFPFDYNVATVDEATVGDETSVPAPLEHLIIDYAGIMYRVQDEEPGQFQLYEAAWKEKIKTLYGIPGSNAAGVVAP
jgi:hypothetical protein